ncbi:hypothetical protein AAJ76_900073648 [Vairimorpha ceranae]|uniref:Uncharacterized protein n=1 Tax=Vairimorpha ceranae TaxID=40302 RepID=A0A0F9WSY9_9MICR|nr:hypothetical protein AAJ76_900073648 [Vairimorpha ceranae]KKO75943.1 hypothetical protein AAJ76_900073648 [Vairimorpha ceranae]
MHKTFLKAVIKFFKRERVSYKILFNIKKSTIFKFITIKHILRIKNTSKKEKAYKK